MLVGQLAHVLSEFLNSAIIPAPQIGVSLQRHRDVHLFARNIPADVLINSKLLKLKILLNSVVELRLLEKQRNVVTDIVVRNDQRNTLLILENWWGSDDGIIWRAH